MHEGTFTEERNGLAADEISGEIVARREGQRVWFTFLGNIFVEFRAGLYRRYQTL